VTRSGNRNEQAMSERQDRSGDGCPGRMVRR
jgi:hypothetical protein